MLTIGITITIAITTAITTIIIIINTNTITSPRIKFGFLRIIHTDGVKQCFMMVSLQSLSPSINQSIIIIIINHHHGRLN